MLLRQSPARTPAFLETHLRSLGFCAPPERPAPGGRSKRCFDFSIRSRNVIENIRNADTLSCQPTVFARLVTARSTENPAYFCVSAFSMGHPLFSSMYSRVQRSVRTCARGHGRQKAFDLREPWDRKPIPKPPNGRHA